MTVKTVLDQYPRALEVLIQISPLCVGCPAEAFHTLADVARENKIDLDRLLRHLDKAMREDKSE
jgi:hybrid cluster-associated redox disulfide protein